MRKNNRPLVLEIAKDVLESLDSFYSIGNDQYGTSSYCRVITQDANFRTVLELQDSREQAKELKKFCKVCALGACFLSSISLTNEFQFGEYPLWAGYDPIELSLKLSSAFSFKQMAMIESAFEYVPCVRFYLFDKVWAEKYHTKTPEEAYTDPHYTSEDLSRSSRFSLSDDNVYPDSRTRLKMIMENIIANDGEFVP
jgi:hypothetical protein